VNAPIARLAWRESRTTRRRLFLYMGSIAFGVAALVAIDSFAANVTESVREQSRSLLGGDLSLTSRGPLPPLAHALVDSLRASGAREARVTSFASMAVDRRTGLTRLVQVRATTPDFPLYGTVLTDPTTAWSTLKSQETTVVDPALLVALDAKLGDTLALGYGRFVIAGTLRTVPGDAAIAAAIGPRVFIPEADLPLTQLLTFGSRAEYKTVLGLTRTAAVSALETHLRSRLDTLHVRVQSATDTNTGLTDAVKRLRNFLGVVALVSLLLGGIGVASGVRAFVRRKVETVAILRCLGATSRQILVIYVGQAAAMGLVGAAAGALFGVALQFGLPLAIRDFLPVDVDPHLVPGAIGFGLALGLWVALWFALQPLLALGSISPLAALRREYSDEKLREGRGLFPSLVLAATVVALSIARAPRPRLGVGIAFGIGVVLLALWAGAVALSWLARRVTRSGWPYVIRQGVANLYRPANQTRAVVLSLGFGAFLIATLYLVQSNVLRELNVATDASRGNVLFFDVQSDQAPGLDSIVGRTVVETAPLVTMRIASVNGFSTAELQRNRRGAAWALRREYRSTYRDTLVSSEHVVAGHWFSHNDPPGDTGEVSLEADVARELGVKIGSFITWDVQGVPVPTRVTSLRDVDWARFEPNFFAVFPSGVLEKAPHQVVVLANVPDPAVLSRLQRSVVDRYPNVSSVDLTLVRDTIGRIVRKVTLAIRFLALFSLALAIPVLFSSASTSRRDRVREGVLLRTLGASRGQIRAIMLAEYAALGVVGALTGVVLSFAGAWALLKFAFESSFAPAFVPALLIAMACAALAVLIGLLGSRDVFSETPISALRAE
jgi:putative ABC transport system permease protein